MAKAASISWNPSFAVGVPLIDEAHQELFKIANRLILLSQDQAKHKWGAQEGIKFLKNYTVRHFSEEEEYMKSINYSYMDDHFAQHVLFRTKVLPRIERRMTTDNFSIVSVNKFLQIVQLWLCKHIIIFDTAIPKNAKPHKDGALVMQ